MNVVGEHPPAVQLHHRQPLAVARLELGVAADVHLLELERVLGSNLVEHRPRPLAEVAPGGGEQRDPRYG